MSTTTPPPCPHFELPEVTKEPLDYADVIVVDFANHNDPARRPQLAKEISSALHQNGCCFLINHAHAAQLQRTFDVVDIPFSGATNEEKEQFSMKMGTELYKGYKTRGAWEVTKGQKDNFEMYDVTTDFALESHPPSIHPYLPELAQLSAFIHKDIGHEVMRLLALDLKLPENTLVNMHQYGKQGGSWTRLIKYYPRESDDAEALAANLWLNGHTDIGSLTVLLSLPVSGLQFHCRDNKWRWAPYIPGALLIQAGDCIEFLSGGYYPSHYHRVVTPPRDQRHLERLGVGYFFRVDSDLKLDVLPSPVLKEYGTISSFDGTTVDWKNERGMLRSKGITNGSRIPPAVAIVEAPPATMVKVGA